MLLPGRAARAPNAVHLPEPTTRRRVVSGEVSKAKHVSAPLGARTAGWRCYTPIHPIQHDVHLSICKLPLSGLGAETATTMACTTGDAPDWYRSAHRLFRGASGIVVPLLIQAYSCSLCLSPCRITAYLPLSTRGAKLRADAH